MLLGHATSDPDELPFSSYFGAVEEDPTASKFSRHLLSRWSAPDLKAYPSFPAPTATLVFTWLEGRPEFSQHLSRMVCSLLGRKAIYVQSYCLLVGGLSPPWFLEM